MKKRCVRGKSCGSTCIGRNRKCYIDLSPSLSRALSDALKSVRGGSPAGLNVAKLFVAAPKKATAPRLDELLNLAPLRQLERSPGARTFIPLPKEKSQIAQLQSVLGLGAQTRKEVGRDLEGLINEAKNLRSNLRAEANAVSDPSRKEELKTLIGRVDRAIQGPATAATGNTRWAREDARDFDGALGKVRREGDPLFKGWEESYKSGSEKVGEGGYGSVIKNPDGTFVKRGEVSNEEARLIQRLGEKDLGPRLVAADINGPGYNRNDFVDIRNGRIAMTQVPGKPLGSRAPLNTAGTGVPAYESYWRALADLHRLGIAHNDAHIDNVLIDDKGKGRWVDLGLAQASPKAALAEALGTFGSTIKNVDPLRNMPSQAAGRGSLDRQGNWQTRRWEGTGIPQYERLVRDGKRDKAEEDFPVLARIHENRNAVQFELLKTFSRAEVASMQLHGIRSPLETYNQGPWARMTDEQAQSYLNKMYEGV